MTLVDEFREAYLELLAVMPSTITFNGLSKPCVAQPLVTQRTEELQGFIGSSAQQVTLDINDFLALKGLMERSSVVNINNGPDLVFVVREQHPNSSMVHLILAQPN